MRITIKMPTALGQDPRGEERPARPAGRSEARDAIERLGAYLSERGLKRSRRRDLVVEAFYELGGHVPVESLVARARERDPRVSVATVYRTMKLLSECGLAVPRQFGDGQTRYEPARHGDHHDHLICRGCGRIVEFESPRIEALQLQVARRHGFEVENHKLELYGRCPACRRRRGREATT